MYFTLFMAYATISCRYNIHMIDLEVQIHGEGITYPSESVFEVNEHPMKKLFDKFLKGIRMYKRE